MFGPYAKFTFDRLGRSEVLVDARGAQFAHRIGIKAGFVGQCSAGRDGKANDEDQI